MNDDSDLSPRQKYGEKCRGCSSRDWKIWTDHSAFGFSDGQLLYAKCRNCGNKIYPERT